jgi:DNA-directed RNA polymerase subunit H (RpoH/RPB5)
LVKFFRNVIFLLLLIVFYEDFSLTKKKRIDVLLHKFVPPHLLLTKEETLELLDKYKIEVTDLPQIFEKDPVAVAIGAKEGDIIRIIRDSDTTVRSIDYYRYVKKEKA